MPGALYSAHTFHDTFHNDKVPFALAPGEQRAVDALEQMRGNVLATDYLAAALPALDGHAGHLTAGGDQLFNRLTAPIHLQRVISAQQIRIVISDCLPGRVNLSPVLGPLGFRRRVYGCAQIYQRRR